MKINKWIRGGKALAGSIACCLALAGCLREEFSEAGSEISPEEGRTYGLGFTIAATSLGDNGMRYGNDLENYINPAQFRILFLDEDGNFRFEFSQYKYEEKDEEGNLITDPKEKKLKDGLRLEPLYQTNGSAVSQWFVRIPTDDLSDEDLKLITDNNFKIAVMANWPDNTFYGEGSNINTNFLQGKEQQIANRLAHCHNDEPYTRDKDKGDGIFASYKPFLGPDNSGITSPDNLNQMSVSMDWVHDYYEDYPTDAGKYTAAEADIRRDYKLPTNGRPYIDGRSGRRYYNMWYIWNFGGSRNHDKEIFYETSDDGLLQAWMDRNDNEGWAYQVHRRIDNVESDSPTVNKVNLYGIVGVYQYKGSNNIGSGEYDGVIFASKDNSESNYTAVETPDGIGFMMPRIGNIWQFKDTRGSADSGDHFAGRKIYEQIPSGSSERNDQYGYFKIPLAADGILRFKVAAILGGADGNNPHNVAIGIHYGANASFDTDEGLKTNADRRYVLNVCNAEENIKGETDKVYGTERKAKMETEVLASDVKDNVLTPIQIIDFPVQITERVQDAYIYALAENKNDRLVIYEIEYIKNVHLADVERDGIQVSKEQPIPMYGIQDFDPIGAYWTPGELFNLSSYSGSHTGQYNYKWISLLRSVAKVELTIAKAPFKEEPQYIYMRSMNRTARLNPIDVMTPTNQIWYGDAAHNIVGIKQETVNIQTYGPMYEKLDKELPLAEKMQRFHNRLAWFFGIWQHEVSGISDPAGASRKWNWNGLPINYNNSIPSPRVFNPHINRSDYTHFHKEGEDSENWYYTLYMPEKHMTDPNKPGDMAEAPKCLRIEMRWEGVNDDSNLDDNASYRIYFADPLKGGHLVGIYNRDDYENVDNTPGMPYNGAYENDLENLKTFWPIVRNHVYEVTVSGINQGDIKFEVKGPEEREVEIEFD